VFLACTASAQDTSSDEGTFLKRNPSTKSIGWKEGGNKVVIRLKSGKTETYDLSSQREREAFIAKYGSLPTAPPPPPPPAQVSAPPVPEELTPPPPPPVAPPPPPKVKKSGTEPLLCSPPLPVHHQ
jgi:hypothetical protein